jgi:hypothetical protein
MNAMRLPFLILLAAGAALSGCVAPGLATGMAPDWPGNNQAAAAAWPAQPGALWGTQDVASIAVFEQPLAAQGRWAASARWGRVFVPAAPAGWRPYQNGRWLENRFWRSDDPWGWATDHYGRWGHDAALGWVWVPDTRWGPSWVAWREADDVVGWAPIPPQVSFAAGIGLGPGWDSWNAWHQPGWLWVPRGALFEPGFGGQLLPFSAGGFWWGRSRWQNAPYWGWNRGWNRGWGWQAPAWAWNDWAAVHPGWAGWGWNRPGWFGHPGGWGGGWGGGWQPGWGGGWDRGWYRDRGWNRRRGAPPVGYPGGQPAPYPPVTPDVAGDGVDRGSGDRGSGFRGYDRGNRREVRGYAPPARQQAATQTPAYQAPAYSAPPQPAPRYEPARTQPQSDRAPGNRAPGGVYRPD